MNTTMEALLEIREQARLAAQETKQSADTAAHQRDELVQKVEAYNDARKKSLRDTLQARGLTWCTSCDKVVPLKETTLLLLEGTEVRSGGYENSCYGFENYSCLHCACSQCAHQSLDKHGMVGEYDHNAHGQTKYYAFRVTERAGKYVARRFGHEAELDAQKYALPEIPDHVVDRWCKSYDLPPRLRVNLEGQLVDPEWIVAGEPA